MNNKLPHIDLNKLPNHVAIIMDGNGRWAAKKNRERVYGHVHGIESVRKIVEASRKMGLKFLTLYTFSTENWQRPKDEVDALMELLSDTIMKEKNNLIQNQIKIQIVGERASLPVKVQEAFAEVEKETALNFELTLSLALNYGGKKEIISAVNRILHEKKYHHIDESIFENYLYSGKLPDVDLMIRTGGEKRISNFLLWKAAYAELYFTNILWPDFNEKDFYEAIADYQKRERRYGKTSEQIKHEKN